MVSSHTGRRTFVTISLKKGLIPEIVMKVSGHKSRESFERYVNITQQEAINKIKQVWDK